MSKDNEKRTQEDEMAEAVYSIFRMNRMAVTLYKYQAQLEKLGLD